MERWSRLGVLLDVVLPPTCAACGLPGAAICPECAASLVPVGPAGCDRCGHPWPVDVPRCPECPASIDVARQAVVYRDPAPAIVAALKDGRRRSLASVMASITASAVAPPPPGVPLVPVPLAPRRRRARGFNQAELIAEALAREWGRTVRHGLERVRDAPAQRGSSATDRLLRVRGAFRVRPGLRLPGAALLVDDVHTTGATLSACARALRAAGVRTVGAVAFARVTRAAAPGGVSGRAG